MDTMHAAQASGAGFAEPVRKTARPAIQIRVMVLVVGVFILSMLVFLPVWNAVVLLDDRVYSYFVGQAVPYQILAACFCVLALHIITLPCVYRLARPEVQTEQMMMSIGVLFITLLGVILTLIAFNQRSGWNYSANDAGASYCHTGDKDVFRVFATSQALQSLRAEPECLKMDSVELCDGFPGRSAEIDLLRVMEDKLMCSGFCYSPNDDTAEEAWGFVNARIAAADPDAVFPKLPAALAQRSADRRARGELASLASLGGRRGQVGGVTLPFPPTLFSKADYQASCDGQTFRHIKAYKTDGAFVLLMEGVALLFASIFVAFLLLVSKCGSPSPRSQGAFASGMGDPEQRRLSSY